MQNIGHMPYSFRIKMILNFEKKYLLFIFTLKFYIMKKIFLILSLAFIASCAQGEKDAVSSSDDPIKSSEIYKNYVNAYNDYASCKMERPQLTTDFMDKKITQEEFATALERNNKSCNIKKEIFNKYYQLLEAEYDKAAIEHKITEE
jgi:hypothetical protein